MSAESNGRNHGGAKPERKILMAVDFGTTFSGLAWAQTRKPDMQTPIIQWPDATSGGLEGITSDKVPTGEDYKWGFQIGDLGQRHQWFKLDLDPSQHRNNSTLAARFPDPMSAPPAYEFGAERMAKDYLTALRKHAEQILRYKLPQSVLQSTPIEYIITVPAVWSDAAQAKTRTCAEKAGMGTGSALHIISEPEAAAVYALDAMDPHNIEVGDTFVLCDAGGGTVDLISYTVSALKPTLKISEANPGSGLLCGSSYLNRIFQQFIETKLSGEPGWDEEVLEEALKRFEAVIKKQFRDVNDEVFLIPVPGLDDNPSLGIRRGRWTLRGTDVKEIFKPVVNEVVKLVTDQIAASQTHIKAVLMVGGFGQSAYLRDCIRQAVSKDGVEVMQSPNGWTAVVRGALMKGLASTMTSFTTVRVSGRSARKHYGISVARPAEIGVHDLTRQYWSAYGGCNMIVTANWVITKGSLVQEDKPIRLPCFNTQRKSFGPPQMVSVKIIASSDPMNHGPPMYSDADGVAILATVKADLSRIPANRFLQTRGLDNQVYFIVTFELEITYHSAYTKYELIHDGVNYGLVAAEYV